MVRAIARDDRADLAAEGDPRGRGSADDRHRRPRAARPHGLHRDGQAADARPRPSPAARRSSPTVTPPCASPATSPSPRAVARGARAPLLGDRARRPDGPARAAPPLRAAGGGLHVHAAALPGAAVKAKGQPGHRATTAHIQAAYPFVAEGGLGGRGVYIGRDVYGGSFCYDPWELYGQGADEPERRRDRDRRPREVEPRQDVRASPVGVRPAGVDRRRQGRVRPARRGARRPADRALAGRPRAAQPAHAARRPRAAAQPPLLASPRPRSSDRSRRRRSAPARRRSLCSTRRSDRRADAARRRRRPRPPDRRDGRRRSRWTSTRSRTSCGPMAFALDQLCTGNLRGMFDGPTTPGTRPRRAARRPQPPRRPQHAHDRARDPDDLRDRLAAGA